MKDLLRTIALAAVFTVAMAPFAQADLASDAATIFAAGESMYPEYFPPGASTETIEYMGDTYFYRLYSTGIILGVSESEVVVVGGPFGASPATVGTTADILAMVSPPPPPPPPPGGESGELSPGHAPCVNIPFPPAGIKGNYVITLLTGEGAGTTVPQSITWVSATATQTVTRIESTFSEGGITATSTAENTATHFISDGYLYETRNDVSTTTSSMGFSFTQDIATTYAEPWLTGAWPEYCEDKSWFSAAVGFSSVISSPITGTMTSTGETPPTTYTVTGVNVSVTTPAGTFNTVRVEEIPADDSADVERIVTYFDRSTGILVKTETFDSSGVQSAKLELTSIG